MVRSFELVNAKVAQANFFLGCLARSRKSAFEFHCYLSAFVAACRSVTYVLQAVMKDRTGFGEWYAEQQDRLRASSCARYFHCLRRLDHHVGSILLGLGRIEDPRYFPNDVTYSFAALGDDPAPPPPESDVLRACHQFYDEAAQVVWECCAEFGIPIDPKVHFTQMNFDSMGQTLSDAMHEVLGHPDAILPELHGIENQWLLLRELLWSTDLQSRFDALHPKGS